MAVTRVQHVVAGAPGGELSYVVEVVDGDVVSVSPGAGGEADLVLAERYDDVVRMLDGELAPDDAFMQGRVKVTGSMGTYMDLLPVLRGDAYRTAQAGLVPR